MMKFCVIYEVEVFDENYDVVVCVFVCNFCDVNYIVCKYFNFFFFVKFFNKCYFDFVYLDQMIFFGGD